MQHKGSQRNTTQRITMQHNATQLNRYNTTATQRIAIQRNATKQTQQNGLQHNATQHNRTHLNTTKQEIKTKHIKNYAKQTSRGNVELDQKLHRKKKRSKNAAGITHPDFWHACNTKCANSNRSFWKKVKFSGIFYN